MKLNLREHIEGYLFISPWILGMVLFALGPILASFGLAFTRWNLFTEPEYVGWANFQKLAHDPLFYKSVFNTIYYTIFAVPLGLVLALGLAMLVNHRLRGVNFFRTAFFLPNVVAGIAMLLLWKWLFDPNFGLINLFLDWTGLMAVFEWIGIGRPQWISSRAGAMPGMIFMSIWGLGGSMMIFLAGLQNIPRELIEAAELDGAGPWKRFRYVTVPLLTPTIFFLTMVGVIASLQIFNQAYVMTQGGPAHATLFYVLYLFQTAFERFQMGYACAMALVLFIITLIVSLIQLAMGKKWVHYQ
ncbi:MAG: sugar ABC transporter permease [Gemmatimonadetes bacterium]|nr:sugar ABC transporter permease [Gemmatimonadota bacterium]MYB68954.1 sugar ABC transporter permease [Gemmatimonadota bacterium]